MKKSIPLGLLGVAGICLAQAVALPFVRSLESLQAEQLMVARGVVTALLAGFLAFLLYGSLGSLDFRTLALAVVFPLACLGLYKGIKAWGVSPVIIVVAATPLANFLFRWARGARVPPAAVLSFFLILGGVSLALRVWEIGRISLPGLLWALFGTLMNALYYEIISLPIGNAKLQLCFWQAAGVAGFGFLLLPSNPWTSLAPSDYLLVLVFALAGGFLYFLANLVAFENLTTETASVLAQLETPAVVAGAALLVGERLSLPQWAGMALAVLGGMHLVAWLAKLGRKGARPSPAGR